VIDSSVSDAAVAGATEPSAAAAKRGRPLLRRLGTILVVVGVFALAYSATVYFWHDPVTDLWARWKQRGLAAELDRSFAEFEASPATTTPAEPVAAPAPAAPAVLPSTDPKAAPAASEAAPPEPPVASLSADVLGRDARRYKAQLEPGDAVGRLVIPRLGIDPIFVNGTSWGRDLSRGPGLYPESRLPATGRVTAIAGHRTTFGAWFRHIDDLTRGDPIDLVLPYGTFHYRVVEHEIVDNGDWSILDPRGYEVLVLSACHPLYSASQRWIVYARLVSVDPPQGPTVRIEPQRT
jgi:sortase A